MSEPGDLEGLDVAVEPAPEASDGRGPRPAPLEAGDTVPIFRSDLRVGRGRSPGLFEVSTGDGARRFALYEFELTIARMLDGRRKVSEVVESGVRLGIPVDVPGLNGFVRQMWHYGFLAPPGAPPGGGEGGGTFPERERWDEATRSLFQTGVRLMRQGRPADAKGYFEAVLDAHPGNAEASEMLALVAKGQSLSATPVVGEVARPPGKPRGRRGRAIAVALLVAGAGAGALVARALRGAPPVPPPAPAAPIATAPAAPPPPAPGHPAPEPPRPRWRSAAVETRRHPVLAEIAAPGAGRVRWLGAAGVPVTAGERIGEVRVKGGGEVPRPELARRIAELERLAAQDPVYRDFLEKARREERRARGGRSRGLPIVAPATGVLARGEPAVPRAAAGQVLGRVVDPATWLVGAHLAGEPPAEGAECEVLGDAPPERARCRVVPSAAGAEGPGAVTVEVAASDAPWLDRAGSPSVRLAPAGTPLAAPTPPEQR